MELVAQATERLRSEFGRVIVGQEEAVDHLILALMLRGHVLLEGVPGVAKTLLVRTLAALLGVEFKRIQFTPDMMPSDILGTNVFDLAGNTFHLRRGPVFCNLLLADEINRTPPKTQAALLEVMEERQATIDGVAYPMAEPFMVCATVNPVEFEGTYPLPEAQLDRFLFKLNMGYPAPEEELALLRRVDQGFSGRDTAEHELAPVLSSEELQALSLAPRDVTVAEPVLGYLATVIQATRESPDILLGASPRAAISLLQAAKAMAAATGRNFVTPDDVKRLCAPVLRHRLVLRPEVEIEGRLPDEVVAEVLETVEVPR